MNSDFLNPKDIEKLGKKRVIKDENVEFEPDVEETPVVNIPQYQKEKEQSISAENHASQVKIDFETMGRFDMPRSLHFGGYTVDHVDNFALVTEDNIFETLVSVIEDLKDKESEVKVEDMLIEELFEVLIGIEARFNTVNHIHKWVCDCQYDKDEGEKIINEIILHLPSLQYTSIEQSDEILREISREMFTDKAVFDQYIKLKYGEDADITEFELEDELSKIKVSEPYTIAEDGNIFKFRYLRVKDLLFANKYVTKKYASKYKAIKNKQLHNVKAVELKEMKEAELEKVNQDKSKDFLKALRKSTLVEYNGRALYDIEDKMDISIPIGVALRSTDFLEKIKFGVTQNQVFDCPICGKSEQRLLYLELNLVEFIPTKLDPNNGLRNVTRGNIFMGI